MPKLLKAQTLTLLPQGDSCEWRILATHGEKIILNVTHLDIPALGDDVTAVGLHRGK